MGRRPARVLVTALVPFAGLVAGLAGCFGGQTPQAPPQAARPAGEPSVGLEKLAADTPGTPPAPGKMSNEELERRLAEATRLLEELQASNTVKTSDRPGTVKASERPAPPKPAGKPIPPANTGLASLSQGGAQPGSAAPQASAPNVGANTPAAGVPIPPPSAGLEPASPKAPEPTKLAPPTAPVDERLGAAADELARALRERALGSRTPAAEYAALAWLDTIRPGVLGPLDSGPASKVLDPRQVKTVTFAHEFADRVTKDPSLFGDPERFWRTVTDAAQPITQAKDVRITLADLCTKVDGYGQYQPLGGRSLLAGSPHTIIVYAEVDSYAFRRNLEQDGERFTVELGHAVEVWQDADRPTLQRRWGETVVKDVSRRQRRDFYITSVVELPPNLSVGAYNLKVIVKDRLKGAQAEKTIPFTIVADGAIVSAGN